jgi:hypothetical protein
MPICVKSQIVSDTKSLAKYITEIIEGLPIIGSPFSLVLGQMTLRNGHTFCSPLKRNAQDTVVSCVFFSPTA